MKNSAQPLSPLDAERQALAVAVWDQFGRRLRRVVARRWPPLGADANRVLGPEAFESACLRGLVIAASKFDPGRGIKLVSFAVHQMRNEVYQDIFREQGRNSKGRGVRATDATMVSPDDGREESLHELAPAPADDRAERADTRRAVRRQVGDLDPLMRRVVMGRFFFDLSRREVAERIGTDQSQVRRLELMALDHLRRRLREEHA